MSTLFDPIQIGALKLPNRIIMAPLTRMRAFDDRAPGPLNAQHYALRASAGLKDGRKSPRRFTPKAA